MLAEHMHPFTKLFSQKVAFAQFFVAKGFNIVYTKTVYKYIM